MSAITGIYFYVIFRKTFNFIIVLSSSTGQLSSVPVLEATKNSPYMNL